MDTNLVVVDKSPVERTLLAQLKTLASLLAPGQQTALFVTVRDWQKLYIEVALSHPGKQITAASFGHRFRIGADEGGMLEVRNSGTEDQRVCDALNSQIFLPDDVLWRANNLRVG